MFIKKSKIKKYTYTLEEFKFARNTATTAILAAREFYPNLMRIDKLHKILLELNFKNVPINVLKNINKLYTEDEAIGVLTFYILFEKSMKRKHRRFCDILGFYKLRKQLLFFYTQYKEAIMSTLMVLMLLIWSISAVFAIVLVTNAFLTFIT